MAQADIGIYGLAVMGENLALNMLGKGFSVAVFNRSLEKVETFVGGRAKGLSVLPAFSAKDFSASLSLPRKIFIMVRAGEAVDETIATFLPYLSAGDILIDGGNSDYNDSERRHRALAEKDIHYIGCGVSGGEEGALHGPSLMPGGAERAWPEIESIFSAIAARAPDGSPCTAWMGSGGAGHFVKMVHNGIEYGDMQIISEAWDVMNRLLGYSHSESADLFALWNAGRLESYLIEITVDILRFKDSEGEPLVDKILDSAGQKGTGKWTVFASLDYGVSTSLIAEAVYARISSSEPKLRSRASELFSGPEKGEEIKISAEDLEAAVYTAKLISYAQGFALLAKANTERSWGVDLEKVASIWRAGCIIRSAFLDQIMAAYKKEGDLANLLFNAFFAEQIKAGIDALRKVSAAAVMAGVPIPAFSAALSWFDSFRTKTLPARLIQAQRDFFGAHGYQLKGDPSGAIQHTRWTGKAGGSAASTYSV